MLSSRKRLVKQRHVRESRISEHFLELRALRRSVPLLLKIAQPRVEDERLQFSQFKTFVKQTVKTVMDSRLRFRDLSKIVIGVSSGSKSFSELTRAWAADFQIILCRSSSPYSNCAQVKWARAYGTQQVVWPISDFFKTFWQRKQVVVRFPDDCFCFKEKVEWCSKEVSYYTKLLPKFTPKLSTQHHEIHLAKFGAKTRPVNRKISWFCNLLLSFQLPSSMNDRFSISRFVISSVRRLSLANKRKTGREIILSKGT